MVAKKLVRRVFSLSLRTNSRTFFLFAPEKLKQKRRKEEENVGLLPDRHRNCWKKKSLENGVNLLRPYWLLLSRKLLVDWQPSRSNFPFPFSSATSENSTSKGEIIKARMQIHFLPLEGAEVNRWRKADDCWIRKCFVSYYPVGGDRLSSPPPS